MKQKESSAIYAAFGAIALFFSVTTVAQDEEDASLEEVVVTGSYLYTGADSPSPVSVISGEDMVGFAPPDLQSFFFDNVPQNFSNDIGSQIENDGQSRARSDRNSTINLRGLGDENTLVVLNGRRVISYPSSDGTGWYRTAINSLVPRIAVERTELLLDGGSAIFGSDAVAGVVNFVTRNEIVLGNDGPRWSEQALGTTGPGFGAAGDSSRPDLGVFRVWSTPINSGGLGGLWNTSYPLTAQAEAAAEAFNPATDAPTLNCAPKGMPTIMGQPYPMQILERDGNVVLMLEEYDTVRTIYLDGSEPEWAESRPLGYSVGRWEGNILIAETTGISWPHFNTSGIPLSDSVETVETFSLQEDGGRLDYTLTITDPATFTEPVVLDKSWLWLSAMTIEPFDCTN